METIKAPVLRSVHRKIMLKLMEAGFHILIIIHGIEANFDATPLIQAMENCAGNFVLLKVKGNTFHRFSASDLLSYGVELPLSVRRPLDCEIPSPLNQMEDKDDSESEADSIPDVIDIKENGLIEITGTVVKNQTYVPIKWTVIALKEKGASLNADTVTSCIREGSPKFREVGLRASQGSQGNSAVTPESSFLVISSLLKMMRFIGENAQISYTGGISAIFGVASSLLQPAEAKAIDSVDYVRMLALASGFLFAAFSWMLTLSKSKKDLGIIAAACAFFSMIIGLFSAIFSHIVPEYRVCLIGIFMFFLTLAAFYASADQDIETTNDSGGDPGPSTSTSSSLGQTLVDSTGYRSLELEV